MNLCLCICVYRIKHPLFGRAHFLEIDKSGDKADIPARVAKRFKHEFIALHNGPNREGQEELSKRARLVIKIHCVI